MKKLFFYYSVLFCLLFLLPHQSFCHLGDHLLSDNEHYIAHYNNNDSSDVTNYTSTADATDLLEEHYNDGPNSIGSPAGAHLGFVNLGFKHPYFQAEIGYDRDLALREDDNPNNNDSRIVYPPRIINTYGGDSVELRSIALHELFHSVQFAYTGGLTSYLFSLTPFIYEGTATLVEDMLYDNMDQNMTENWCFLDWVHAYLRGGHTNNLWESNGYITVPWWRYLADQYGSYRTEPDTGHDVLERLFEIAGNTENGAYSILDDVLDEKDRYTTAASDTGVSIEQSFQDFSIACWLRRYKNPFVDPKYDITVSDSGRYYFLDENDGIDQFYGVNSANTSPYDDWPRSQSWTNLTPNSRTPLTERSVEEWGTKYLICDFQYPSHGRSGYGIGFWAQSNPDEKCFYSIAAERASGAIDYIKKSSVNPEGGNEFHCALMRDPKDPYIRLMAIVNGKEGAGEYYVINGQGFTYHDPSPEFDSYFAYFEPTLDVKEPNQTLPAYVGDNIADPERFILKLRITAPEYLGEGSLKGLSADQFTVYVSSVTESNKATVLNSRDIFGEYWLTVQAPPKSSPPVGPQPIFVQLGTEIMEIEEAAVIYENLNLDQMLVIDRSGSMLKESGGMTRMTAARAAAQLFADAAGSDDLLGVVRFNGDGSEPPSPTNSWDDADIIWPMSSMSSQITRDLVGYLVDESNPGNPLNPTGLTSIGDGLYQGAAGILADDRAEAENIIILLSDGHENEQTMISDQLSLLDLLNIKVYTIALGPHCDEAALTSLANITGGRFYKIEADEDAASSPMVAKMVSPSNDMIFKLADVFLSIHEDSKKKSRLLEQHVSMSAGETRIINFPVQVGGLKDARLTAFYPQSGTDVTLTIEDPSGNILPFPSAGSASFDPEHHIAYRISSMADGEWSFELKNNEATDIEVQLVLSGRNLQGAVLDARLSQVHNDPTLQNYNLIGLPMIINASLVDANGPIIGAEVIADVIHPTQGTIELLLRDNGGSHDGDANDGVYAGVYRATTKGSGHGTYDEDGPREESNKGSYLVSIHAAGQDNFGRQFDVVENENFHIYSDQEKGLDSDGDGMVNNYENLHSGLDPYTPDDLQDNDQDGLTNYKEYLYGTLPNNADTDGGGESDGSEITQGTNPHNFRDDRVVPSFHISIFERSSDVIAPDAWLQPNQNVIVTSMEEGIDNVELWRTTDTNSISGIPFAYIGSIAKADDGIYIDQGLTNGTTYFYLAKQNTDTGSSSRWSKMFTGTPKADPVPPVVSIITPKGDSTIVGSPQIDLFIIASDDSTEMKISLDPEFSGATWQPFDAEVNVALGSISAGDKIQIYIKVRDNANNQTEASTTINIRSPLAYGFVEGVIQAPLDYSHANCVVKLTNISDGEIYRINTDSSGNWRTLIPAGTYDISFALRGYDNINMSSVTISAGSTSSLGTLILSASDDDNDSILDVYEYRDYETSPNSADTDADGFSDQIEIFTTKTDANSDASLFKIENIISSNNSSRVLWSSASGVVYQVYSSTDLLNNVWTLNDTVDGHNTSNITEWIDTENESNLFYKIIIP